MRFQFSIRELLAFVVFVALACAGFLQPSPLMASVVFSLTLAILSLAILAAVGKSSSARFYWIGFALAGWGYLWVAHWPDEGQYGIMPQWKLQANGPLLTTKLLRSAFTALHPPPENYRRSFGMGGMGGGFMSVPPEGVVHGLEPLLAQMGGMGGLQRPAPDGPSYEQMESAFLRIGHSLWALLFAYLGGRLTRHFFNSRKE